jgi:spore maturation protein CgeB
VLFGNAPFLLTITVRVKWTIFGLTLSSSWGNGHATPYRALLKALHALGHQITFFEKDVPYYAQHRDLTGCDYCDLVFYSDWDSVRSQALGSIRSSDVVMTASYVPEGARINAELLDEPKLVRIFYDLDTPVTFARWERHEPVAYVLREQLREFDLVLSFTGGRTLDVLRRTYGVRNAQSLYGCVDADAHYRVPAEQRFVCDLSYMATFSRDRQQKVEQLFLSPAAANPQMDFLFAGSLYPWGMPLSNNIRQLDHVSPGAHAALYSSSLATLNVTRAEMATFGYCPSGRFFEAAACGTPVISDWFEGLDAFFADGEEVFIVRSGEQVAATLRLPRAELRRVGECARQRTLAEHTGTVRARQLIAAVETCDSRMEAA